MHSDVDQAADKIIMYNDQLIIGNLAGRYDSEKPPDSPTTPKPKHLKSDRKRIMQVVDPASGRVVDYGMMRPGNHAEGGKIVGYR